MKAIAVVVTYNPIIESLARLIASLIDQCIGVVIVDNSVNFDMSTLPFKSVKIISNFNRNGIAGAQNLGIKYAKKEGVQFVCFFDQDSILPDNFAARLINGTRPDIPSVYCPLVLDEGSGAELPSFRISRFGIPIKVYSDQLYVDSRVDLVISSGSVVHLKTFEMIGFFNEELFIDLVDFEWCFRCRVFNIPIYCIPEVKMMHSIGVGNAFMTGSIHNPVRHYYKQRNPFYLLTYDHIPLMYSLKLVLSSLISSALIICSQDERKAYLKVSFKAVYDGVRYIFRK